MFHDAIYVFLEDSRGLPIHEYCDHDFERARKSSPPGDGMSCLISVPPGDAFKASLTVTENFSWRGSDRLLVTIAYTDGSASSDRRGKMQSHLIHKRDLVAGRTYTVRSFDFWDHAVKTKPVHEAMEMPQSAEPFLESVMFTYDEANLGAWRGGVTISVARGTAAATPTQAINGILSSSEPPEDVRERHTKTEGFAVVRQCWFKQASTGSCDSYFRFSNRDIDDEAIKNQGERDHGANVEQIQRPPSQPSGPVTMAASSRPRRSVKPVNYDYSTWEKFHARCMIEVSDKSSDRQSLSSKNPTRASKRRKTVTGSYKSYQNEDDDEKVICIKTNQVKPGDNKLEYDMDLNRPPMLATQHEQAVRPIGTSPDHSTLNQDATDVNEDLHTPPRLTPRTFQTNVGAMTFEDAARARERKRAMFLLDLQELRIKRTSDLEKIRIERAMLELDEY